MTMRRALVVALLAVGGLAPPLSAQVLTTAPLGWDAMPGATGYSVTFNGATTDVGMPATDPRCGCPVVLLGPVTPGSYTVEVSSYNANGASLRAPLTFTITFSVQSSGAPAAPTNLTVR